MLALLFAGGVAALMLGPANVQRASITGLVPIGQSQDDDADDDRDEGEVEQAPERPEILTVLLVGLDSREGLTEQERRELSSGDFEGSRADSIMLAQVRTDGSAGALLSFPRDLRVTRCDGSVGKLNAAYTVGELAGQEGGSCLVETLTALAGIPINHYVEVDFAGFVDVIDAIGGVELCVDEPMRDAKSGLDLPAGCQTVDSVQALAFARARSMDDDFGRMERQQQLLTAILDGATSGGIASDVPRALRVLDRVTDAVRADDGFGFGAMRDLAMSMRDLGSDKVATFTVPGDARLISEVSYVIAREAEAAELYARFRDGSVLERAAVGASAGG